ncbi:hypothetical protein Patl1_22217 [Pistacia atlantica]|uniref:Uncharacterized protein n=1 Tax=Pistacia atlantica TaxID=434234 RepID=A0ACC1BJW3_9ROSI|nr:hypothetical protein Patl1_22217 [Pistacia atlantica]
MIKGQFIEWIDCCCAGTEMNNINGKEELHFPVSSVLPCKDVIIQHPRTKSCELLSQLPSSIPLDFGSDADVMKETVWTKVFIPVVPEDPHVIDFITAQCSRSMDDSISDCSDQIDDEDDAKYRRRAGKGPQFKNLVELLKEIKELQDELEEHSDDEGSRKNNTASMILKVQVEVAPLDGNEFFIKVFCEHNSDGFVKLMEALNSLVLEVTNANITHFRGLVSNVFKKKSGEMVRADHVKDSLLELTRNPSRLWPHEMAKTSDCINGVEYNPPPPYHHHQEHHLHNHRLCLVVGAAVMVVVVEGIVFADFITVVENLG